MRDAAGVETLSEYYADAAVRRRILEYCGDSPDRPSTCVFLAEMDGRDGPYADWDRAPRCSLEGLDSLLADGADIARSTWDTENLLVHLDIDYQNTDEAGEAYQHPVEVFFKLEPTYDATQQVLRQFGLPLFTLMTGRGYHFTGRVPLGSSVVERMASLVPNPPPWVAGVVARRRRITADISPQHARAHAGGGLLIEFLAHEILKRARHRSRIPVVLNGTAVGPGTAGRECVSIDLSHVGDALDVRHIRVAFGAYQKHRFRPDIVGPRAALEKPFITIPRNDEPLPDLLTQGRQPRYAIQAARSQSAYLPVVADGMTCVIAGYEASSLREFHRRFYATPVLRGRDVDDLFAAIQLAAFPACVMNPLLAPNDLLLQPAVVQHVTRALMAHGMSPRDIAAVVHSRYTKDFGWGGRWFRHDAETRAEFDVRVFAGLVATSLDRGVDFNCRSAQEKGLCPGWPCAHDLRADRVRLLDGVRP